jgi:hypothetical protein
MILATTNMTAINDFRTDPPTDSYFLLTLFDYLPTIS